MRPNPPHPLRHALRALTRSTNSRRLTAAIIAIAVLGALVASVLTITNTPTTQAGARTTTTAATPTPAAPTPTSTPTPQPSTTPAPDQDAPTTTPTTDNDAPTTAPSPVPATVAPPPKPKPNATTKPSTTTKPSIATKSTVAGKTAPQATGDLVFTDKVMPVRLQVPPRTGPAPRHVSPTPKPTARPKTLPTSTPTAPHHQAPPTAPHKLQCHHRTSVAADVTTAGPPQCHPQKGTRQPIIDPDHHTQTGHRFVPKTPTKATTVVRGERLTPLCARHGVAAG